MMNTPATRGAYDLGPAAVFGVGAGARSAEKGEERR